MPKRICVKSTWECTHPDCMCPLYNSTHAKYHAQLLHPNHVKQCAFTTPHVLYSTYACVCGWRRSNKILWQIHEKTCQTAQLLKKLQNNPKETVQKLQKPQKQPLLHFCPNCQEYKVRLIKTCDKNTKYQCVNTTCRTQLREARVRM